MCAWNSSLLDFYRYPSSAEVASTSGGSQNNCINLIDLKAFNYALGYISGNLDTGAHASIRVERVIQLANHPLLFQVTHSIYWKEALRVLLHVVEPHSPMIWFIHVAAYPVNILDSFLGGSPTK
jgi:hypothetical protein